MTVGSFVAWFFVFFSYFCLGITLGYHRLLTHKSLKVPNWVKYAFVSGGYLCFMGGPVNWVGVHRLHHQKSDQPEDPHSPTGGFKHSLYGWMFTMADRQNSEELKRQVPDLMKDPVLCWFGVDHTSEQAKMCLAFNVLFRALTYIFFGPIAFVANVVASIVVFWAPQLVNSVCHMQQFGYRFFDTRDYSRNVWWVALLSGGEGWHNNHHAIPRSAKHGMAWWEFDYTYMVICILEKLGLATDVVRPKLSQPLSKKTKPVAFDPKPKDGRAAKDEEDAISTLIGSTVS